jgi:3-oxoacyl-[acyl-carrier protein] reductase
MNYDFSNRKVLITGGSRGIGAALVKAFLSQKADVTYTGQKAVPTEKIDKAHYLSLDFNEAASIETFLKEISNQHFDILINNAGINKIDTFDQIELDDFRTIQKVNVEGPFILCKQLVRPMAEQNFGRIINIASIFSSISKEKRASYSASKFALVGLSKALALDYATKNVLVNVVSPGFIDTELTRKILTETQIKDLTSQVPMKRLGTPEEIAEVVLFLASSQNTFITGQNIIADGGFTCV